MSQVFILILLRVIIIMWKIGNLDSNRRAFRQAFLSQMCGKHVS